MTYTEKVIQLSIEGGWREGENWFKQVLTNNNGFLLDPLFWQSLGKSLGWDDDNGNVWGGKRWLGFWHDFIDHLAEGRDAESFFESLLKQ